MTKIGDAKYVSYTDVDGRGISVHDPAEFYDGKPVTLMLLKEYGGVCGAVSKFATSVCQTVGIPAMPVAQPGHCAHIWLTTGNSKAEWKLSNDCGGLGATTKHDGVNLVWEVGMGSFE